MKTKIIYPCLVMLSTLFILSSCKKDVTSNSSSKTTTTSTTTSSSLTGSIALTTLASTKTSTTDTIYLVNCFPSHGTKDSVAFSALPSAIGTYLTANYSGYTFEKAFKTTDSLKVANGFVVIIKYNGNLIGLKFSTSGTFEKVLEQKDGANMGNGGLGWHEGGPFCDRDGKHRDTIALSALPTAVSTYFTTTYPTDTLLHAFVTPDTTYVLISKDTVLYATNITATGTLISRIKVASHGGRFTSVAQTSLLASITTYLTTTYPGYVFQNAFSESVNGSIVGYHVFITSNSTNYVVNFDSSGTFVSAKVVH
ncbi:hypothetical protein JN11_01393 [Mucilaginibacter frigoritolerans]|uniref:PepSY-like beta-lactamase-inhibitor n=1 Tax=Mucilaginibacter frigoritolerans TaxID=652788 RepID=A0A562UB43_9SPHI|nr:hypothetical protein [Mucilaginibacter frigoritolerans]TWJ02421.1 hypothetical protein JN11_01393 [Mucilaginibacter frigoritolerans]